jgi:hypothetical protein
VRIPAGLLLVESEFQRWLRRACSAIGSHCPSGILELGPPYDASPTSFRTHQSHPGNIRLGFAASCVLVQRNAADRQMQQLGEVSKLCIHKDERGI